MTDALQVQTEATAGPALAPAGYWSNQLSRVLIRSQGKGRDPQICLWLLYYNYESYLAIETNEM